MPVQPRWNKQQFIEVLAKEVLTHFSLSEIRATQSVNGVELFRDHKPRMPVFVESPKIQRYSVMSHSSFHVFAQPSKFLSIHLLLGAFHSRSAA